MVHAFVSVYKYKWIFSFRLGSLSKNDLCPLSSMGTPEGQKRAQLVSFNVLLTEGARDFDKTGFLPIHSQPSPWKEKKKKSVFVTFYFVRN